MCYTDHSNAPRAARIQNGGISTKRALILLLIVSLSIIAFGTAAFGEADLASMSAEALLQAGKDAEAAEDYGKAMEYYQLAADQGDAEAVWSIGALYYSGYGVE